MVVRIAGMNGEWFMYGRVRVVIATWLIASSCLAQDGTSFDRQWVSHPRAVLGTESNLSASVRSGDLDGDGDLDLVVANGRHWPQQNIVFLNQSRARFNIARPLGIDRSTSYACELADLDSDGDLDIVAANDNAPCLVFLNDGKAMFSRHRELATLGSVRSLTVHDIDSDGDVDLLVTCRGQANRIHFNDGSAGFDRAVDFGTQDDSTISMAAADLNEDGHQDLILANRDAQSNTILLATGRWSSVNQQVMFQPPVPFGMSRLSSRAVVTADFNADGHVDWAVGNLGHPNTVYFGDGSGGVKREISLGTKDSRTYCLAVGDMNNDGAMDIVAGNVGQPNAVYFNADNGAEFVPHAFGEETSVTYGLCLGDLNGDGFEDVAVANSGQVNRIYFNQPLTKTTSR